MPFNFTGMHQLSHIDEMFFVGFKKYTLFVGLEKYTLYKGSLASLLVLQSQKCLTQLLHIFFHQLNGHGASLACYSVENLKSHL